MKKRSIVLLFIFILAGIFAICQEPVQEHVEVKWWVVPLFAVDSQGNPVLDLKPGDLEISLDRHKLDEFVLIKRDFAISRSKSEKGDTGNKITQPARKKMIFLLFDNAVSGRETIDRSRAIACEIVKKAKPGVQFVVMSIDPNSGLTYLGGPSSDKEKINLLINEKVSLKRRLTQTPLHIIVSSEVGGGGKGASKYTRSDYKFLTPFFYGQPHRQKNISFLDSFQSLFYSINSIKDHKFIYLFSDGIDKSTQVTHSKAGYYDFLKNVADMLGKSGALLFVINPIGVASKGNFGNPGEDTMRYLAKASGGAYLEGAESKIVERIDDMHHAYYEVGFGEVPGMKKTGHRLTVKAKGKGIRVHSLRALQEETLYSSMSEMEKEIQVVNMISGNPLFRRAFSPEVLPLDKNEVFGNRISFQVTLPQYYIRKELDLFKIWINRETGNPIIKKESLVLSGEQLQLEMKRKEGMISFFVLIHGYNKSAFFNRVDGDAGSNLAVSKTPVRLQNVELKDGKLSMTIDNFVTRSGKTGLEGKLDVRLVVENLQGIAIFDQTRTITSRKDSQDLSISMKWLQQGKYYVVVEVKDIFTGMVIKKRLNAGI